MKPSTVTRPILVALGLFMPLLRELRETLYQWERPWLVDDSKFRDAFGAEATDIDEAIRSALQATPALSSARQLSAIISLVIYSLTEARRPFPRTVRWPDEAALGASPSSAPSTTMRRVTITDERRLVTVLFADLVGFTGRAEESDPEAVRELQRAYFGAVAAEVERFGGNVEKYIGDAAMALFGAPQAHDDDAERALRAALSIREAVGGLEGGLEVRIGVNTGEVVGGTGGPQHGRLHRQRRRGERCRAAAAERRAERDPGRRHDRAASARRPSPSPRSRRSR